MATTADYGDRKARSVRQRTVPHSDASGITKQLSSVSTVHSNGCPGCSNCAPHRAVAASATGQNVVSGIATQAVIAIAAVKLIVAGAAADGIIAGARIDGIIARPGLNGIVAAIGLDQVIVGGGGCVQMSPAIT